MKILNVYFKNINSLIGENRIDFDKPPISEAGVFAITGANGSGKSSILDAMTLALYGETFRFNKPAEHVMTKNTSDCFSHVEFLVNEQRYCVSWQAKREETLAGSDGLVTQMKLVQLGEYEQVLAQGSSKVRQQVIKLTGMDFRRFTRSIMLVQGDFSAFLNALDTERLEILEGIISHDIYADYKDNHETQMAQAAQSLGTLTAQLATSDLLSDVQREAAELDLADQRQSLVEFKQEKNQLLQLQAGLKDRQILELKITGLEQQQIKDRQQLVESKEKLQIINESADVTGFKQSLQSTPELTAALEENKQEQHSLQQDLQKIEQALLAEGRDSHYLADLPRQDKVVQQKKIDDLKMQSEKNQLDEQSEASLIHSFEVQLPEKQQALSVIDRWLSEHKQDYALVDNMPELGALKNLRVKSAEIQKQLKVFNKAHKNSASVFSKGQSQLNSVKKSISAGNTSLEKLNETMKEIADGHSLEDVVTLHADQRERIQDFVELLNLAKAHKKLLRKGFSKRFAHLNKKELEQHLDTKKEQVEGARNIQRILDNSVYREQLTIKLTEDRNKLEYNSACALCGSLEHPYLKSAPHLYDSKKALSDQLAIVKGLQVEEKKLTYELAAFSKVEDQNTARAENINRMQREWLTLCARLNTIAEDFDITSYGAMKVFIKREKKELNAINQLIQDFRSKKKDIAKLEVKIIKGRDSLVKAEAKQKVLDESTQSRPQEIISLETELVSNMQTESTLAQLVSTQLLELGEKIPEAGREDKLYDLLSQRREAYQSQILRQKSLQTEVKGITDKVSVSEEQLQAYGQKKALLTSLIRDQELSRLYYTSLDKKAQVTALKKTEMQSEFQLKEVESVVQNQLEKSPYTSLEQVQGVLGLLENQREISLLHDQLEQKIVNYPTEVSALKRQLEAERVHISSEDTLEGIVIQLRDKTVQMEIATQERVMLEKKLAEQQQLRQDNQQLLGHIDEHKVVIAELEVGQQQIKNEPEHTFKQRVQADVVDKLLASTNGFLDKINGRYHIVNVPCERGLAIEISDNKQKNSNRSIKSLSGGEAFVVSLAMALGLSELANNGRAIDSLFIDEGFGNLDAETLYTVVSTLENLQATGKIVGVISHVEGIKQRIKTQIELVKQSNGASRIILQKGQVVKSTV